MELNGEIKTFKVMLFPESAPGRWRQADCFFKLLSSSRRLDSSRRRGSLVVN